MADDISDDKKCDFCKNEVDKLFRCEECNGQQNGGHSVGKKLCNVCAMPHLKCNHTLTDGKGGKVLVCAEHKMFKHEYCRTCDAPFCWGCISKHSEHKLSSLDERATEVRKKVFESLSEFENEEKLMNAVKAEIVEKIEKHEGEQKILREKFIAGVEKLRKKGLETIDENCKIMKEHLKAVDDVVEIQQKLRDLLSVSNDHLVNEFREIDKELKQLRIASLKMKTENAVINTCDVDSIVAKVEQLHASVAKDMKSVLIVPPYFCIDTCHNLCYRISLQRGQILLEDVIFDNSGHLSFKNAKTQVLKEEVTHCFSVMDTSFYLKILILTSNKSAYLFNPADTSITLSTVPYPTKSHLLCPFVSNQNNLTQPHWSYWEGGVIKFTHDASFTVQCAAIPSQAMEQYSWIRQFFVSSDNTVIVVDTQCKLDTRIIIPDNEQISCVSFNYNALFIITADGTSVYTAYYISDFKLSDPVKHNWDNQSNVMTVSVNNYNYSITKAAIPSDTRHPYLIQVRKI